VRRLTKRRATDSLRSIGARIYPTHAIFGFGCWIKLLPV